MSMAIARFDALKRHFIDAIPNKDRTAKRLREATWAASLTQVIEQARLEIDLGLRADTHDLVEALRYQVDAHLFAPRSKACFRWRPN